MPKYFRVWNNAQITFRIFGYIQFKQKIVFLKEIFFYCCFCGREPIRLLPKKCLACRLQFQILNMWG